MRSDWFQFSKLDSTWSGWETIKTVVSYQNLDEGWENEHLMSAVFNVCDYTIHDIEFILKNKVKIKV